MSDAIQYTERGQPIGEARVATFEEKLGQRLPDDYRQFLLDVNGCIPTKANKLVPLGEKGGTNLQVLYGLDTQHKAMDLEESLASVQRRERGQYPSEALPIGNDGFGNPIVLAVAGERCGEVFFQAYDDEPVRRLDTEWYRTRQFRRLAGSFTEFLANLRPQGSLARGT